ncbi:MAG: beta-lactamase family protein [Bacteroidales bacterium]|nr:beta-lactamase family protein [Bacteroidales bacterium]
MSNQLRESEIRLQRILENSIDKKDIFGTVVSIYNVHEDWGWTGSAGNLTGQSQYFIASVTKLYVTAIIQKLRQMDKLQLEDKISEYLTSDILKDLHVFKGKDYSDRITVRHLLSNTSGLPDYFLQKKQDGMSLVRELTSGHDQKWTFSEAIQISKSMQPHFKPGEKGKAFYSDTNFQLLGKIIETTTDRPLPEVFTGFIINPLDLKKTYLYQDINDTTPAELYYRDNHAHLPLAMTSFWADGSMVSTAEESVAFLKAFFGGQLFPEAYLSEMQDWNRIFFPFQYGLGIVRFKLPFLLSPFRRIPPIIGHMGTTGAFAYYCPEKDTYIAGTINQVHDPGLPYRLIVKILNIVN